MKLIKAIIPVLFAALATGFTACSDDDDYVVGQQSPGAYFEASLPDEVLIPMEGPSFEIQVNRTSAEAPATYAVTSDAPSCFNVPSTVTFNGDALTTSLVVTYDPADVEQDKPYEVNFTLDPASNYGNATYSVTLLRSVPKETIAWSGHTTGIYTYTQFMSGAGEYNVTWTYNPNDPKKDIVINVEPSDPTDPESKWFYDDGKIFPGIVLRINMPDADKRLSNGCIPVFVEVQQITGDPYQGNDVAVCDMANFYLQIMENPTGYERYKDYSYYDPKTGTFSLYVLYALLNKPGNVYSQGGYEYLSLSGFPNYEVDAVYKGLFKDADGEYSVQAEVMLGSDVATAKTALVSASTDAKAVDAVVNGEVEAQEIKAEGLETYPVSYPVSSAGNYFIVVVSYDSKGDKQLSVAVPVEVELGGGSTVRPDGEGSMLDGWVTPAFQVTSQDGSVLTPEDLIFPVDFGVDSQDASIRYLVNPYNNDNFPITYLGGNAYGKNRNIAFTLDGDYFAIEPQLCGFGGASWGGEMTIGNYEGYIAQLNGFTKDQVIAFMAQRGIERCTVENGIVTVPVSLWARPATANNDFGYSWTSWKLSMIGLPEANDNAVARAKAKSVANPQFCTITSRAAVRAEFQLDKLGKKKTARINRTLSAESIR